MKIPRVKARMTRPRGLDGYRNHAVASQRAAGSPIAAHARSRQGDPRTAQAMQPRTAKTPSSKRMAGSARLAPRVEGFRRGAKGVSKEVRVDPSPKDPGRPW